MSTQSLEREVRIVKDDMQDVKDILRDVAIRQEAAERRIEALEKLSAANAEQIAHNAEQIAHNAEQIVALTKRDEANSEDLRLIIKAVEQWWGDFRAEYGPGPSGRSDDWEPHPNE